MQRNRELLEALRIIEIPKEYPQRGTIACPTCMFFGGLAEELSGSLELPINICNNPAVETDTARCAFGCRLYIAIKEFHPRRSNHYYD